VSLEDYDRDQENPLLAFSNSYTVWPLDLPQNSCTPLIVACATGFEEAVELLLDHGASATMTDRNGKTPQDYLCLVKDQRVRNRIAARLERKLTAESCAPSC
jgi:hypothetical protein